VEKRAVITIVVCTVLFFVWVEVVSPLIWPKKPPEIPQEAPPVQPEAPPKETPPVIVEQPKPTGYSGKERTMIYGPFVAKFTSKGAGLESLQVRTNGDKLVALLGIVEPDRSNFAVRIPESGVDLAQIDWDLKDPTAPNRVTFEYVVPGQWKVTKEFALEEARHALGFSLQFQSLDGQSREVRPELLPFNGILHDSDYRYEEFCQGIAGIESSGSWSIETVNTKDVIKEPKLFDDPRRDWIGLKNRYFAAVFLPKEDRDRRATEGFRFHTLDFRTYHELQGDRRNITTSVPCRVTIPKQGNEAIYFQAYLGPIRSEDLEKMGRGLGGLFNPSGFDFVAGGILWILNLGNTLFHNYGIAILFTTLVIRILLFPLSKKSQVSMYRIQQLGPKLQILRDRYKEDREKFGQEQMKLFRENKINPMSGCLPLLLQLPIFIGMYGVLDAAFDLRQSPFAWWIRDLSMPDHLLGPWKPVEFLFVTVDALNLLPIVMTITWFLQSYFAPRSADPQMAMQQKMMMIMPVVFGVMCYNLASGLSFYFFVNSLLSMAETKLIKKFFLPREGSEKASAERSKVKGVVSK